MLLMGVGKTRVQFEDPLELPRRGIPIPVKLQSDRRQDGVRVRQRAVELEGPFGRRARLGEILDRRRVGQDAAEQRIRLGKPRVRKRVLRIHGNGLLVELLRRRHDRRLTRCASPAPDRSAWRFARGRPPVWAMGIVIYEMASGERPFTGQTSFEVTSAILERPPRPTGGTVPPGLGAVIERWIAVLSRVQSRGNNNLHLRWRRNPAGSASGI